MIARGSADVGCGRYDYLIRRRSVITPKDPPKPILSKQYCHPSDTFGDHGNIQPEWQAMYTGYACAGTALRSIKKDDPSTYISWDTVTNGVPYNYQVYWKEGCDSSITEMDLFKPLANNDATCISMLSGSYKKCEFYPVAALQSHYIPFSFAFQATMAESAVASQSVVWCTSSRPWLIRERITC